MENFKCQKTALFLVIILSYKLGSAQIANHKEWSKDVTVYKAKEYLLKNVFDSSAETVKFDMNALAAAKSGELTTAIYECTSQKKEGLLFGFYEDYSNDYGLTVTPYGFKSLSKARGTELMNKIDKAIEDNNKFLKGDEESNIYFQFEDMTILVTGGGSMVLELKIRIFWKEYDAEWDYTAFTRTKRRLAKQV